MATIFSHPIPALALAFLHIFLVELVKLVESPSVLFYMVGRQIYSH